MNYFQLCSMEKLAVWLKTSSVFLWGSWFLEMLVVRAARHYHFLTQEILQRVKDLINLHICTLLVLNALLGVLAISDNSDVIFLLRQHEM